jgi:hypothetical protein
MQRFGFIYLISVFYFVLTNIITNQDIAKYNITQNMSTQPTNKKIEYSDIELIQRNKEKVTFIKFKIIMGFPYLFTRFSKWSLVA